MKKLIACGLFALMSTPLVTLATEHQTVTWTAVFSDTIPNAASVTQRYCDEHTPTVIVTTIKQITSKKGVKALNGVWIKYNSYVTHEKNGLYFNIVKASVYGELNGKKWSEPMKLYEQTLTPTGVTNTVWATKNCKGKFLGTATVTS